MRIKLLALALIIALALGMLASCDGKNDPADGNEPDPTPTPPMNGIDVGADVFWEDESFVFSLTENSNLDELPASSARYLAGDTDRGIPSGESAARVDEMVAARNDRVEYSLKIKPTYVYVSDANENGWGSNYRDMEYGMQTYIPGHTPDVYSNFSYDLVHASLCGAFANLYTASTETEGHTDNNFAFTKPDYVEYGTPYKEIMRSFSLSRSRQYVLASDYFVDTVRALLIVPINLELLKEIPISNNEGDLNYDRDGDGEYTVNDFYGFVYGGGWTYQTLAEISAIGFYDDKNGVDLTGNANGDLGDRLVFALSSSSQTSVSGMLFTSSVTVVTRELDMCGESDTEDYVYSYPDENPDLYAFCDALSSLMNDNRGIISVSNDAVSADYSGDNAALLAIRDSFVGDSLLFGGVTCLGALEASEYDSMRGSIGIAPVPLFRTERDGGYKERYMTQIHNLANLGAINAKTAKFAMVSAYLDLQSRSSHGVLDEYVNGKLLGDAIGAFNADMLAFIRLNVRTAYDKTIEEMVSIFWHQEVRTLPVLLQRMIAENGFVTDGEMMEMEYRDHLSSHEIKLTLLRNSIPGLPE